MLKRVLGIGAVVFLAVASLPAQAQMQGSGQPAVYTYIADWAVPREQWRDYAKLTADERDTMDKLIADGTIISYGEFTSLLHQEGHPTHGSWFTATSRAGVLKALDVLYKLPQVTFPVRGASKHWDFLTVSRIHGLKSGKFQGAYLAGAEFQVKPGKMEAFFDMSRKHVVPIMEKLKSDGVVVLYTIETEDFHSEGPGTATFVYVTADAAGIDKVSNAIEAEFSGSPALQGAFESFIDMQGHHDFLARVGNMVNK